MVLRPATWRDRRPVFEWLAESDVTPSMHGLPRFPDNPIPTWEEFCRDYRPHFFSGSDPPAGRCFIISAGGEEIGVISYGGINRQKSRAELDIWMSCEANCGRGHGARAIMALCLVLREEFGVVEFVMRPSARNARAIRAYEKAGFERLGAISPEREEAEYGPRDCRDSVVLVKRLSGARS